MNLDNLSEEEIFKLYRETDSEEVRNAIVSRYLYIAEILAKKMSNRGVEYDDLYQVAAVALIGAVKRFDVGKGLKFATFATPSILGELKNYFRDKSKMIRMGRSQNQLNVDIKKSISRLSNSLGRAPTYDEIAEDLKVPADDVIEALEYSKGIVSLDSTIDESATQLYEVIPDEHNVFEKFEDVEDLKQALSVLNAQEKDLIVQRFYKDRSQAEVAKSMGVSQMFVSRLERKILEKLKTMFKQTQSD